MLGTPRQVPDIRSNCGARRPIYSRHCESRDGIVGGAAACANAGVRSVVVNTIWNFGADSVSRFVSYLEYVLDPVRSESTVPGSRMYLGSAERK